MDFPYVEFVPAALGCATFLVIRLLTAGVNLPEPPSKSEQEKLELERQQVVSELASELDARQDPEQAEPEPGPEPEADDSGDEAISLRGPLLRQEPVRQEPARQEPARQEPVRQDAPAQPCSRNPSLRSSGAPTPELGKGPSQGWLLALAGFFVVTMALDRLLGYYINSQSAQVDLPEEATVSPVSEPLTLQSIDEPESPAEPLPLITLNLTRQSMAIHQQGKVSYYKSAYWGNLNVGTPDMPFKVVFDTGSGHLILPSTYCRSETCRLHQRYKRSASTSAKDIDYDGSVVLPGSPRDQITVNFGTGEVTGVFVEEIVCVEKGAVTSIFTREVPAEEEDILPPPLAPGCARMRFIAAVEMSEDPFKDFHFDGVLGLGLSGLSQSPEFNFPHVMAGLVADMGGSAPHTFSVFLADHNAEQSSLEVGGWSRRHFEGNLAWSPVLDPELGHWLVRIKSMKVDGEKVNFCEDGSCKGVVDTGTSLMAVPTQAFPEIFEMLRHPAPLEGSCRGKGPTLEILLEGESNFTMTITPKDYSRAEPTGRKRAKPSWPKPPQANASANASAGGAVETRKDIYCKPMLMAMDLPAPIGPKLFIFGEPVLRRYYTVYNTKDHQIGFGLARHEPEPQAALAAEEEPDAWFHAEEE